MVHLAAKRGKWTYLVLIVSHFLNSPFESDDDDKITTDTD